MPIKVSSLNLTQLGIYIERKKKINTSGSLNLGLEQQITALNLFKALIFRSNESMKH